MHESFLRQVIEMAAENVSRGGGPFAAMVVRDGAVISAGTNQVTLANDPTAHAEIVALREACRILGSYQLTGCEIYTSCEPCPMCLGAIYWARPTCVYYAAGHEDAAAAGFDDSFIYRQIQIPPAERSIPMIHVEYDQAGRPFQEWVSKGDRTEY
jgi:guanine deaminase